MNNILAVIQEEVAFACGLDPMVVQPDASLITYGLDSVRSMEMVIGLEEVFEIEIDDYEVAQLETVADVIQMVSNKINQGSVNDETAMPLFA